MLCHEDLQWLASRLPAGKSVLDGAVLALAMLPDIESLGGTAPSIVPAAAGLVGPPISSSFSSCTGALTGCDESMRALTLVLVQFLLELKDVAVLADAAGRVQSIGHKLPAGGGAVLVVRFCLMAVLTPGLLGFRASEGGYSARVTSVQQV